MKTRAAVAWAAGKPLTIETIGVGSTLGKVVAMLGCLAWYVQTRLG